MGIVPIDIAIFDFALSCQQRHKTYTIPLLHGSVLLDTCYLKNSRIEIFNHQIISTFRIRSYYTGPAHDHRFAYTALVSGTFSAVERVILCMQFSGTGMCSQSAIIGHEKNDCIFCQMVAFQIVHQISQTFIHPFNEGGIGGLYGWKSFIQIFLIEAIVRLYRRMNGIMSHI